MITIFEYGNQTLDASKLHTKQLLRILRQVNKGPYCECCHDPEFLEKLWNDRIGLLPILKAELAKREHVPNKIEAKRIRQAKAQARKNLKDKKYVNAQ